MLASMLIKGKTLIHCERTFNLPISYPANNIRDFKYIGLILLISATYTLGSAYE
jgi:hypothetical protein